MAEDKRVDEDEKEGAESGDSSKGLSLKTLAILGVVLLLLIGGSVGGTLYLLSDDGEEAVAEESEESQEGEQAQASAEPAKYFPLNPPFVINFDSRGRQRYLQAEVTVMARDSEVIAAVQTHMPLIRNQLVMLFSGQNYQELQTDEGRQLLEQQTLAAVQGVMQQELGRTGVEKILFTNFVMQ